MAGTDSERHPGAPAHPGTTTVTNVEGITVGAGLSVTDDGDGTVTIDR